MTESKREMRDAAIERLREHIDHPSYYRELIQAIVGDDFCELTGNECVERIIDLLADDSSSHDVNWLDNAPCDSDGVLWLNGGMLGGDSIPAPLIQYGNIHHANVQTVTQRENDTIGLPTDAFGNTMHFGDSVMMVSGPRRNQKSIVRALRDDGKVLCDDTWLDPAECAVDFKPKIEDILAELETIGFRNFGNYDAIVKQCAELAEELRELWEDRDE